MRFWAGSLCSHSVNDRMHAENLVLSFKKAEERLQIATDKEESALMPLINLSNISKTMTMIILSTGSSRCRALYIRDPNFVYRVSYVYVRLFR